LKTRGCVSIQMIFNSLQERVIVKAWEWCKKSERS